MTPPSVTGDAGRAPTTAWPDPTSSTSSTAASTAADSPSPTSGAKPTGSPHSWRLEIVAPDGRIYTSNDGRPHWSITANRRRLWRRLGWGYAINEQVPRLPAATVTFTCHMRNWSRVDQPNLPGGPTCKGLLDGLVDARVIPDDSARYLDARYVAAPLDGGPPRVVVEIAAKETP